MKDIEGNELVVVKRSDLAALNGFIYRIATSGPHSGEKAVYEIAQKFGILDFVSNLGRIKSEHLDDEAY